MPTCRVMSGVMASRVHTSSGSSSARSGRTVAVGLLAAAMALGAVTAAGAPAHAGPGDTRTGTLGELIAQVPVAPPLYAGYRSAEQFIPKAVALKKDSRGCNLRQQTIIALATVKPKVRSKCRMSGGTWVINGGTTTVKSPKGLLVQPIIDYRTAWGQGAYAWTPAQRLAWATNVGPTSSLRGKAVNVQATQTLVNREYVENVDDVAFDFATDAYEVEDFQFQLTGCGRDIICISRLVSYAWASGLAESDIEKLPGQAAAADAACAALGARTTNLLAWGLSVDAALAGAIGKVVFWCTRQFEIANLTRMFGITPVAPTTGVPTTYVAPPTDKTAVPAALFDGYPATAPEGVLSSQAFGLMAPIDWAAPTVPWGFTRVWDSGASWREVETADNVYNWSKMDAIVKRAKDNGSAVMYVLGNTPGWANGGQSGATPPTKASDAADFIGEMCAKYGGSIASYQVWNEGNILDFWNGDSKALAALTKAVKDAVTTCGSGAKVIASSAGARAQGGFESRYKPYLEELKALNWPVDGFSVHSYPAADGTPVQRGEILQQWKAMLSGVGAPDRLLYDTELNYGLAGLQQAKKTITDAQGAQWLMQSYIQSQQYGLDGTSWFVWTGTGTDDKVGIQMNTSSTLVNKGWTEVRSWLDGSRMYRCAQRDELFGCQLKLKDGTNATALWMVDGGTQTMQAGTLGTTVCSISGCTPVLSTAVTVTGSPILLKAS